MCVLFSVYFLLAVVFMGIIVLFLDYFRMNFSNGTYFPGVFLYLQYNFLNPLILEFLFSFLKIYRDVKVLTGRYVHVVQDLFITIGLGVMEVYFWHRLVLDYSLSTFSLGISHIYSLENGSWLAIN